MIVCTRGESEPQLKRIWSTALGVAVFWATAVVTAAAPRPTSAPIEGMRDATGRVHALVGARIVLSPEETLERGTLVLRDGRIVAVGADVAPPADARVWDVSGRVLYPGFIESDSTVFLPAGLKAAPTGGDDARPAATPPAIDGASAWNPRVTPERDAAAELVADAKTAEGLRELGFTTAQVVPARGIFRGQGALVSLGEGGFRERVIRRGVSQAIALEYGRGSGPGYPTALMGAVALVRQTLLDAQWYAKAQEQFANNPTALERPETNTALAALGPVVNAGQPVIFDLADELQTVRLAELAAQFKLNYAFRGTGYEYRVLPALRESAVPVIVPLGFPTAPAVEDPVEARSIPLHVLEHWELAPTNAARLAGAGVPVILTSSGLAKPGAAFWPGVRKAVKAGLSEADALDALTRRPAQLLGVADTRGTLAVGQVANVVVASGNLFGDDTAVIETVWVEGDVFELEAARLPDARGTWQATWSAGAPAGPAEFVLSGRTAGKLKASAADKAATVRIVGDAVTVLAPGVWFGLADGTVQLSAALVGDTLINGEGVRPDGVGFRWSARRVASAEAEKPAVDDMAEKTPGPDLISNAAKYPAGAYGRAGAPAQPAALLIRNATVWTSAEAGVIEGADLLIERGKISRVGRNLAAPAGAEIIDATGKHVSAGIIDCHSHTAILGGVNESSHSVTIEVRVADALDPTDINIYRQLAGGKTTSNVLHGSANTMGGQNAVIKHRWGAMPADMLIEGAAPGVKFALGENVTRKNRVGGDVRYPVTRMGVREVMVDTFARAKDYEKAWAAHRADPKHATLPRYDLQLEAALEMLRGERLIHIHSYRQDEVLMFIRLAQELKLTVGTFQHILEGYKVADQIAAIGAGGSTFSDWWAYKAEVLDAIPQNGPLMALAGVVVSFNSDDDELARRLNTDAAKVLKYGDLSPAEALNFVTINPAKQLRIDDRVGSLEPGKDADFVIWSGSPLSTMTRAEQTWIDGRRYFSIEEDAALAAAAETTRAQLVQKILPERRKALGGGDDPPGGGAVGGSPGRVPAYLQIIADARRRAHGHSHDESGLYFTGVRVHQCSDAEEGSL